MEDKIFVGIFWFVGEDLVSAGCPIAEAVPYGDCLTYDGGHAEHWESWQQAGSQWLRMAGLPDIILHSEYDEHPRGRVVKEPEQFVIYADRRIQTAQRIALIRARFGLDNVHSLVRSDLHYR